MLSSSVICRLDNRFNPVCSIRERLTVLPRELGQFIITPFRYGNGTGVCVVVLIWLISVDLPSYMLAHNPRTRYMFANLWRICSGRFPSSWRGEEGGGGQ